MGDKAGDKIGYKSGDKSDGQYLSGTQSKVMAEMRNNPNITIPQIAKNFGKAKSTVDSCIAVLKKAGVVEHVGSNKAGYWKVNDR